MNENWFAIAPCSRSKMNQKPKNLKPDTTEKQAMIVPLSLSSYSDDLEPYQSKSAVKGCRSTGRKSMSAVRSSKASSASAIDGSSSSVRTLEYEDAGGLATTPSTIRKKKPRKIAQTPSIDYGLRSASPLKRKGSYFIDDKAAIGRPERTPKRRKTDRY
eukprot:485819_1